MAYVSTDRHPLSPRDVRPLAHIHNLNCFVNNFVRQILHNPSRIPAPPTPALTWAAYPIKKALSPPAGNTDMKDIDTILLDRDGTLIEERHYLRDPDQVCLATRIAAPWRRLAHLGCRFFLVSNQSGIGRGLLTLEEYRSVHARLQELLQAEGLSLQDSVFCPHGPEADCDCRKPRPGLWRRLVQAHNLRGESTVMVGDKVADIRFGHAIGCAETVLVMTGYGPKEALALGLPPLDGEVQRCPARPGWPAWQASDLAAYLTLLVQRKEHVHAHRI